jgi:hypothetical protein
MTPAHHCLAVIMDSGFAPSARPGMTLAPRRVRLFLRAGLDHDTHGAGQQRLFSR